jgi:cell division protein FtsL
MKTNLSFTEKYSYSIIAGAVLLLIASMCSGCSAKTTTKNETKNDSLVKDKTTLVDNSETKNSITTKSDSTATTKKESEFKSFFNEFEFESSDPTKESTITDENGKKTTFKNLKGKKRNLTTVDKNKSLETVNLIKSKNIELHRKNKLIMERNIEIQKLQNQVSKLSNREQFNWSTFVLSFWWLWLILIVAGYLGYRYYKGLLKFPLL